MSRQLPSTPVGAAMRAWMGQLQVERGVAHNTVLSYTRDLARYAAHLERAGVEGPDDVTQEHVTDFLAGLREGDAGHRPLSVASAARMLVTVRGFHRFAAEEGLATADPAADVVPPRAAQRLPKAISVDDVGRLIQAAGVGDGPVPLRDRALVETLYGTGARISEAIGLALDDLDLDAREVRLAGKGGKERVVPLGGYARDALEAYLVRGRPALAVRGSGAPHVFLNGRGAPMSRQSAWNIIQGASARARIGHHVSPHILRHSFATHLLDGGADVRVVQELLGHASVTTTQIYTLVTTQHLREVYAQAHPRAR